MKKIISVLLTIALVFCVISSCFVITYAQSFTQDYYTYEIIGTTAKITNVDKKISPDVVVPQYLGGFEVTAIGNSAFFDCEDMISVTIPDSVTQIGTQLFQNCQKLESVKLPDGIEAIPDYTFYECVRLKEVNVPSAVKKIGEYAFYKCESLESITLPDSITYIGSLAFHSCASLNNVTLPQGLKYIENNTFGFCSSLTDITVPDSVEYIKNGAFDYTAIVENHPDGIIYIGKHIYKYKGTCPQTVTIKEDTKSIGENAFSFQEELTSITIQSSVKRIDNYAFYNCTALETIEFSNISYVGSEAFSQTLWYDNLTDGPVYIGNVLYTYKGTSPQTFEIKQGIVSISESALAHRSDITTLIIPDSLKEIGSQAFYQNGKIKQVYVSDLTVWLNITFYDNFANPINYNAALYINDKKLTQLVVPESVTEIKNYAFSGYENLTDITLHNRVERIGVGAFERCKNITQVNFPDSLKTISEYAFHYCDKLSSITIGKGIEYISNSAFVDCDQLKKVYFRGEAADLEKLTIPKYSTLDMATWYFETCIGTRDHSYNDKGKCTICGDRAFLLGDIDGDGSVNATDLAIMKLFLAGLSTLEGVDYDCGDLNRDTLVNAADLATLKLKLAGIE